MGISILVAKIMALLYLASGLAALFGQISFKKFADDYKKSPALTFLTGFTALVFGMIIVQYHNVWVKNWTVLITFIGWAALLKGIMLIVFPNSISPFKGLYKNNKLWGILMLLLGLLFGYFGFVS